MKDSRQRTGRLLLLAVAVAAIGASEAQAGAKPQPNEELTAIHWKHEDAVYGSSKTTQTAEEQLRAAHWKHEATLSRAGSRLSATPEIVAPGDGVGWGEALGGVGGAIALLVLGSAATIAVRRRHGRLAQS